MRARCKATYFAYRGTEKDEYQNDVDVWDPDGEEVCYYGLTAQTSEEPITESFNRLVVDVVMLAPRSLIAKVTARGRMRIGADTYEVIGVPSGTDLQPFAFRPGGRIQLSRTSG